MKTFHLTLRVPTATAAGLPSVLARASAFLATFGITLTWWGDQ